MVTAAIATIAAIAVKPRGFEMAIIVVICWCDSFITVAIIRNHWRCHSLSQFPTSIFLSQLESMSTCLSYFYYQVDVNPFCRRDDVNPFSLVPMKISAKKMKRLSCSFHLSSAYSINVKDIPFFFFSAEVPYSLFRDKGLTVGLQVQIEWVSCSYYLVSWPLKKLYLNSEAV